MHRPAAAPESDDILSSLRMLVSDRPEVAERREGPEDVEAAEASCPVLEKPVDAGGRLILTAAQRVVDGEAGIGEDGFSEDGAEPPAQAADDGGMSGAMPQMRPAHHRAGQEAPAGQTAAQSEAGDGQAVESPEPERDGIARDGSRGECEPQVAARRRLHLGAAFDKPSSGAAGRHSVRSEHEEEAKTFSRNRGEADGMSQARQKADYDAAADDRDPEDILLAEEAEESILDENTLREIVVQTVREELMGELGERITRNVKKLVRREIHRALASREFE